MTSTPLASSPVAGRGSTELHRRPPWRGDAGVRRSVGVAVRYLALTKPRIIELLLVTTVPAMMLAEHGVPPPGLVAATVFGGALAAGGANTINCYLDRDIDAVMQRTSSRPMARGTIQPAHAVLFGLALSLLATAVLAGAVNLLSAGLADAAILFYVFVYTLGLKRRHPANIVIGGAAGAVPALVGWAAVTGRVGFPAVVLFLVVVLWTPPHFWALAMTFADDYRAARVPMLPSVSPPSTVARRIVLYTYATVAASLLLSPYAGWPYALVAGLLGAAFLLEAHRLRRRVRAGRPPAAMRLFHASISYLTLLFAAVAVSSLLP